MQRAFLTTTLGSLESRVMSLIEAFFLMCKASAGELKAKCLLQTRPEMETSDFSIQGVTFFGRV